MVGKPNRTQRKNARRRNARADVVSVPANLSTQPRRPLHGLEGAYEITRDGHLWSMRLNRGIQWSYGLHDSPYISVQYQGVRHAQGIAEAVVHSWLSDAELALLLSSVPETALGDSAALRSHKASIALIARDLGISENIAFGYLLSRTRVART